MFDFGDFIMCFPPGDKIHSLLSFFLAIAVITTVELLCFPKDESNIIHELTNLEDSKSSNKL